MNWKQEAIDKLKGYTAHKAAVLSLSEEIKRLEAEACGVACTYTGNPATSGKWKKRKEDISNVVMREELKNKLEQAERWVSVVDRGLAVLTDTERRILRMLYILPKKGNIARLCDSLGIEQATVYRRRNEALERFILAVYGVE